MSGTYRAPNPFNDPVDDLFPEDEAPGKPFSAVPRKISAELDVEDQLIWDLRAANYSDTVIANRLIQDGFTHYKPASIASRYRRIVQKIQEQTDELLEADLTDWHEGEDDALHQAYARAEARVAAEIQAARNNLYTYTSLEVNTLIDTPRYSATACKNRLDSLHNGTARQPPELNEDPEAYALDLAVRKEEFFRQKARNQEREAQAAETAKANTPAALAKLAAKAEQDRKKAEIAAKRAAVQAEKDLKTQAHGEFVRRREDTKKAHRDEERAKVSEASRDRRILRILQRNYEDKIKDDEAMAAQERHEERRRAILPSSFGGRPIPRSTAVDDDEHDGMGDTYPDFNGDTFSSHYPTNNHTASPSPYAGSSPTNHTYDNLTSALTQRPTYLPPNVLPRPSAPPGPALPSTEHIDVSEDPALDPREIMAKPELMNLIIERGMSKNREKETKALLTRRLRESDRMATLGELHGWLRRRGLSTRGNRAELVWRLQEYDARMSRSWRPKHMATLRKSREAVRERFNKLEKEREQMLPRPGRFGVSAGGVPMRVMGGIGERGLLEGGIRETVEGRSGSLGGSNGGYSRGSEEGSEGYSRPYGPYGDVDVGHEQRGFSGTDRTPDGLSSTGRNEDDNESLFMGGQREDGPVRHEHDHEYHDGEEF
ncbi:hypothetical protein BDZ85DRAFT_305507 [Elsinoe ampelina]|uniref:SAP domain-containing protein n=1 Tax=Elsinoe ampelina TaxID=302913 RepID=A0A6A6GL12_9PEZI|nr:hypothetical protein BDZ85DRAFT_305507 [Elsinoe ampelina]